MNSTARTIARLSHLKRLRWGVFAGVVVGIAVSVATNVLHAQNEIIAQAIAAWPPLALFGGIELISRIPSSNRWLSAGRILATIAVAGVAGSISYGHMVGAVEEHGETGWQANIWPISVDGLMLVATLSLVEVVAKIRQLEAALEELDAPVITAPVTPTAPVVVAPVVPAPVVPAPTPVPVVPAPVVPVPVVTPSPVEQAEQVVADTSAAMPIPVSPAPASAGRTTTGPMPRRAAFSPLRKNADGTPVILMDRAPRV